MPQLYFEATKVEVDLANLVYPAQKEDCKEVAYERRVPKQLPCATAATVPLSSSGRHAADSWLRLLLEAG